MDLDHDAELGVILPIGLVPNGGEITKRTGQARYTVTDKIRIFAGKTQEEGREIEPIEGVRWFTKKNGDFNAMPSESLVVWITTFAELSYHVNEVSKWGEDHDPDDDK